jgi:stalled ribosome rescue protein Dom34
MKTKSLGIWMDNAEAHLMELSIAPIKTIIVSSAFTHSEKEHTLAKSEKTMHNKEQQLQSDYYKKLGESIINYETVLLFGPTNAKSELVNFLKADHHFDKIKIEVRNSVKMTENQEHSYVRRYFSGY